MTRRIFLPSLLLAGLVLATATADPAPDETITSPYTGRTYEVHLDTATGNKVFRGPDGREFPDLRAIHSAELKAIGDPKARIDPTLWDAVFGSAPETSPRELVLVLADQPLQRVGGTPPAGGVENVRAWREWVIAETARRAAVIRAPVLERLAGHRVVGTSSLLNAIFLVAAPADLPEILENSPEIWSVQPAGTREVTLNAAVPTSSAGSFWTGGYDGTGITVGVIDTGMDNQHPAIKAAITSEAVYLTWGKNSSDFADDATTTDDLHGHGTHCGGIVASRDTTYTGVAKKASLVNAKAGYLNTGGLGGLHDYDIIDATHWTSGRVDVLSLSFGGGGTSGDGPLARLYDAAVSGLGIHVAVAAGNSGPTAKTILSPGDAFNVVTAGASNDKGTTSVSDDAIASFSSRGPTIDLRRKPTISAPGYLIYSANHQWEGTTADFKNASGTSMACPHVAGALALLMDYKGTWKPESLKALLVNSSRTGSPYPSTPDNTWGWGGLDLGQAYTDRTGVIEGSLTSSGSASVYYTRSASLATGDRATLVWNRQVTFPTSGTPGTPPSLLDVDLYLYDGSTGVEHSKSASTLNPVEQVITTAAVATPVLRVKRTGSFPTGTNSFTTQPFAVAAPAGFTMATAPALEVTVDTPADPIGPGKAFDVTVTVDNTGVLPALTPTLTLTVPTGFTLTTGSVSTSLATIAGGGSRDVLFTLTSPATSAAESVAAGVESTSYGSTFTAGPVAAGVTVDGVPPTGSVVIQGGAAYTNLSIVTLTLTATDAHSGVASMRLAEGAGDWGDWRDYSPFHSLTLGDGDGVKTARAQYRDRAGNLSTVVTDTISLDTEAPTGTLEVTDEVEYTNADDVTVALFAADSDSGLDGFRVRVVGGPWSAWETLTTSWDVVLTGADGTKTIEVVYRDRAGNLSTTLTDSVVLDRTAPTVAVSIEDGADSVNSSQVAVAITSGDNLSGVDVMSVSTTTTGPWEAIASTRVVPLDPGEGTRDVRVRVRDRAGNVSEEARDTVLVDLTAPTGSFGINDGAPYLLPEEPMRIAVSAADGDGGSGIVSARFRFDGGWSDPYDLTGPALLEILDGDRPTTGGLLTAGMVLIDEAGNESDPIEVPFVAISPSPPRAPAKLAGTIDFADEVEAWSVDLVRGDRLSVKLKDKALVKGEFPDAGLDLVRPDGRRLVRDKYPATLKSAGIKGFVAPETGRYFLLVYRSGGSETFEFKAKVKVQQSKASKKLKGEVAVVAFEAVDGSKLKGSLQAEGLTADRVRLVGPDGEVPFLAKEKNGKVTITATILDAGTGTYEFVVDGEPLSPVKHKLTCSRPKS